MTDHDLATDPPNEPRGLLPAPTQRTPTRWTHTVAQKSTTPVKRTEPQAEPVPAGPSGIEVMILLVLGAVWLVAMLRLADNLIMSNRADAGQLASAISIALPTVISATLLAGVALGLAVSLLRLADPHRAAGRLEIVSGPIDQRPGRLRRALFGAAGGTVLGLLLVLLIVLRYGGGSIAVVLATMVAVAAVLGGASAFLPRATLAAAVTGTLAVFVVSVVGGLFQSPLKAAFGATTDPASQLRSSSWVLMLTAVLQGAIVGLSVYFYLRRRVENPRWPVFALTGAMPGLVLLVGLALTVIGGSGLSGLSGQLSDADRLVRDLTTQDSLNQALTVAFVGAIVAMIMIGRTLRHPADEDD